MKKTRRKKADEGRGVMVWLSRIACSYSPGTEKIWKRHGDDDYQGSWRWCRRNIGD